MSTDEIFIDPIRRLRELGAAQAKTERAELFAAFREAIADDVRLTENQQARNSKITSPKTIAGLWSTVRGLKPCSRASWRQ